MRTLSQFGAPLTPFIRSIHLKDPVDLDGWNEAFPLLVGLQHIRSLAVTYMPWHEIASNAQSAFLHQFADITSLRLSQLEFSSFSELVHVLGSFVRLETLVLNWISYSGASGWNLPPPPRHSLCNLSRLELRSCQVDVVLAWLVSFEPMPPLHTVYLHGIRSDACRVLGKFLRALGPSLEVLFYEPHAYHGMSSPPMVVRFCLFLTTNHSTGPNWRIELSHNTSLRCVHVNLPTLAAFSSYTQTLSQIVSMGVQDLVFTINPRDDDDPAAWERSDEILARELPFSHLRLVEIRLKKRQKLSCLAWSIAHLPRCHARGILRACWDSHNPEDTYLM
jgi:hypothetical protein